MNQECKHNQNQTACQEQESCCCDKQEANQPPQGDETKKTKCAEKKGNKKDCELENLAQELAKNQKLLAEQNDKYLRLCAEYDNFRKRTAKEKEGIYNDAISFAVTEMLPIIDNFERAFSMQTESQNTESHNKGMELIFQQFMDYLKKLNVTQMDDKGKSFDPQRHVAVMHIEDDSFGPNEVVEIFQNGYLLGDKVIRTAMVKVAN